MPSLVSEMLSISKMKGPKDGSTKDIEGAGYKIGKMIVEDDISQLYTGKKGSKRVLIKLLKLDKCSPRYKANLMTFALKVSLINLKFN